MRKQFSWVALGLLLYFVGSFASEAQSQRRGPERALEPIPNASLVTTRSTAVEPNAEAVGPLGEWRVVPLEGHGILLWREPRQARDKDPRHIHYVEVDAASLEERTFEYSGTDPAAALWDLEADLGIAVRESLPEAWPAEALPPSLEGTVPGYWAETVESSATAIQKFGEISDAAGCRDHIDAAEPLADGIGVSSKAAWPEVVCFPVTPWTAWKGGPISVRSIPISGGQGVNCLWSQTWTRTRTELCTLISCDDMILFSWRNTITEEKLETDSSSHPLGYICPAVPPGGMPKP